MSEEKENEANNEKTMKKRREQVGVNVIRRGRSNKVG